MKIKKQRGEKKLRGKKVKGTVETFRKMMLDSHRRNDQFVNDLRVAKKEVDGFRKIHQNLRNQYNQLVTSIRKYAKHSALIPPEDIDARYDIWRMDYMPPLNFGALVETATEVELPQLTHISLFMIEVIAETDNFQRAVHTRVRIWNPEIGEWGHYKYMVSREALEMRNPRTVEYIKNEVGERLTRELFKRVKK